MAPTKSSGLTPTSDPKKRDLRVDFYRGLALLVIFADHQEVFSGCTILRQLTPVSLTYFDALEVFLFLSGYVGGRVYNNVLMRDGFRQCMRKATHRAVQLFIINVFIYLIITTAIFTFTPEATPFDEVSATALGPTLQSPVRAFVQFLVMRHCPTALNILPLYSCLLIVTPAFIAISRRSAVGGLGLSVLTYLAAQLCPSLQNLFFPENGLNPLAWQLVYCLGIFFATATGARVRRICASHALIALSTIVVTLFFAARHLASEHSGFDAFVTDVLPWIPGDDFVIRSKPNLHWVRILNFLAVLHVAWTFSPNSQRLQRESILSPIIRCGQHSLVIFSCGLILNYVGAIVIIPAISGLGTCTKVVLFEMLSVVALLMLGRRLAGHNGLKKSHF